MNSETGKYIIVGGVIVVVVGLLVYFFHDKLGWLGRLPGDISIQRENFRVYFPFTTMILLSVLLTVILSLIRKWF